MHNTLIHRRLSATISSAASILVKPLKFFSRISDMINKGLRAGMDNRQQIEEIRNFALHLCRLTGQLIPEELAARIWIRKYAKIWRLKHPVLVPVRELRVLDN